MLKIQIIGHLGQDAKINEVNGKNVINYSVADTQRFKNTDGTEVEKTIWVNLQQWTENTKVASYLTKGRLVFVEGYPSVKTFKNKDGVEMASLNVRVTNCQLLGKNATTEGNNDNAPVNEMPSLEEHLEDKTSPF